MIRLTAQAHEVIAAHVKPGDIVVDATIGNGYDSVFLARLVGDTGHVYGFDIQRAALTATAQRLAAHGEDLAPRVTLINSCHSQLADHVPDQHHGTIACAMFNLGYLPGGEHHITTGADTTLLAIAQAVKLLRRDGIISVLCYPGHKGGQAEVDAILHMTTLSHSTGADWREIATEQNSAQTPRLFIGRCDSDA